MKKYKWLMSVLVLIALSATSVNAAESKSPTQILIKNVHVWDGSSDGVTKKISVLVEGKLIIKDGKIFKNTL